MTTYLPPANLADFDRSEYKDELYQIWHNFIFERAKMSE